MVNKFLARKTPDTKYSARYVKSFPVNLPVKKINLYQWVMEMTDADYTSYSTAHKAMCSFVEGNVFYMKNVENIGIETLIQHYELKYHAANHVQFYSPRSKAYIMRWFPATIAVPWELYVQPSSPTCSLLTCMIGIDFPGFTLKTASWFSSIGGLFLRKHLEEECRAFAQDIEEKFN